MGVTTIKVDSGLRDRISAAARERGQAIGDYLEDLVRDARRRERLQALAASMRENPADHDYWSEVAAFDALSAVPRD